MYRLLAIFMMIAFLSSPFIAQAGQSVLPNGVSRIGAENPGATPLDYATIGVAIIDTGIALDNPDLNVVGGVDCSVGAELYQSSNISIDGAQQSIWEPAPLIPNGETTIPDPSVLSFSELTFQIASQQNPYKIGGARPGVKGYDDGNGHGTHVAGIIAAKDDGQGVVGVAPNASLYSVRVLGNTGGGSIENLICGLDWVAANADTIDVANMSLGAQTGQNVMDVIEPCGTDEEDYPPYVQRTSLLRDELHEAVCRVTDAGVALVVAAGNGWGDSATVLPAAYPEVITVSSFADFDGLPGGVSPVIEHEQNLLCPDMGGRDDTFFTHLNGTPGLGIGSFGGEGVDIVAPGVCIFSTFPTGFASLTGTSMATPHVTAVIARMIGDSEAKDPHEQWAPRYQSVADIRAGLLAGAEAQTSSFRDSDQWHEPIVRVIP